MKRTKVLLIGTGSWAEQHIRAYGLSRWCDLVGIVGHHNRERTRQLAATNMIPAHFMDVRRAISETEPDVVDVASNPRYRLNAVKACCGVGVKLVNL